MLAAGPVTRQRTAPLQRDAANTIRLPERPTSCAPMQSSATALRPEHSAPRPLICAAEFTPGWRRSGLPAKQSLLQLDQGMLSRQGGPSRAWQHDTHPWQAAEQGYWLDVHHCLQQCRSQSKHLICESHAHFHRNGRSKGVSDDLPGAQDKGGSQPHTYV